MVRLVSLRINHLLSFTCALVLTTLAVPIVTTLAQQTDQQRRAQNQPKPKAPFDKPANHNAVEDLPILYELIALALQTDSTRIATLEAQISTLNQQIAGARKAAQQDLMAQKARAQGELDLNKTMQQTFQQMSQFMASNNASGAGGLEGSINELEHSVPEITSADAKTAVNALPQSTSAPPPVPPATPPVS